MDLHDLNATAIACVDERLAIGKDNGLLYHIKGDMDYFKANTLKSAVIMGRKTFESLPNGPLKDRHNLVVTNSKTDIDGCEVINDLAEWLLNPTYHNVNVIGGEKIYRVFLPFVRTIKLTKVFDESKDADAFFPEFNEWFNAVSSYGILTDKKTGLKYQHIIYKMNDGALYQPVFDAFRDFLIMKKVRIEFEEEFEKAQGRPMSFIAKNHQNNNICFSAYHTLASSTLGFLTCSSSSFVWSTSKRGHEFWFDLFTDFKEYLIKYLLNNV